MGAFFIMLTWLSIKAAIAPVRRFHVFSLVIAAVSICLAYIALRTAIVGQCEKEEILPALLRGMIGALVALIVTVVLLILFRPTYQAFLAHALGRPASSLTFFRLLLASTLLGFGTGFVMCVPKTVG